MGNRTLLGASATCGLVLARLLLLVCLLAINDFALRLLDTTLLRFGGLSSANNGARRFGRACVACGGLIVGFFESSTQRHVSSLNQGRSEVISESEGQNWRRKG